MVSINPDKFIRKAVHDKVNNIVVSGKTIKAYDSKAPISSNEFILLTYQTKDINRDNKCEYRWDSSLLIEIYTRTTSSGNTGSRVLLNDIEQSVITLLTPELEIEGFSTLDQVISYETQLDTTTDTEIIMRSFLRLNLTLI